MSKLKNATKRISAVAASAVMVSSAAFAAGLGDYPNNFVQDGKFNGQVVVGADAAAIDSTSAASIIDDLAAEFSGENNKVKISYKKSSNGGEEVQILDSGKIMKYGQDLNDVRGTDFDDKDLDVLADGTFDNGADEEDYEQFIGMTNNGYFEHALRDDQESEISTHLWLEDTDVATYKFDMKSTVSFDSNVNDWDEDFVGETLRILGNEYTIVSVKAGTSADTKEGITELELVGGANKVSLGEGETTTVTVDGVEYEVSIQSVSDDKVLLTVNGESQSIDNLDTDEVGGVTIAVTDLVSSSRDAVKGYAEIVVGGNKIKLTDNTEVELNDEDISDVYEDYKAIVTFQNSGAAAGSEGFEGFTITYSLDDEVLLSNGDMWDERVFDAFGIRFDGTNDVDYTELKVTATSDKLNIEGTQLDGSAFNEDIAMLYDDQAAATTASLLLGSSDDDRMLVGNFAAVGAAVFTDTLSTIDADLGLYLDTVTDAADDGSTDSLTINGVTYTNVADNSLIEVGNFYVNVSEQAVWALDTVSLAVDAINLNEASGLRFLTADDMDDQQLYEFGTYSSSAEEVDVEDILTGDVETDIDVTAATNNGIANKLTDLTISTYVTADQITALSTVTAELFFENEFVVDLSDVADDDITANSPIIQIYTDKADLNADDETTGGTAKLVGGNGVGMDIGDFTGITLELDLDTTDDMFDVTFDKTNSKYVLLSGAESDVADDNDNEQEYVDTFGTKIVIDSEDKKWVKVMTPSEQVEAQVYLVTGASATETGSVTVDEADVEAKKAELEEDGYTITGTEDVASEEVEFDVESAVMDSDVTGTENMIVVGGPAVNQVARDLMGIDSYTIDQAGVEEGEAVVRYFESSNSVLVYGYAGEDTAAAAEKLNMGGLSGDSVNV